MINRVLIRIKVIQTVYACYQKGLNEVRAGENELMTSLRKSYDLYHYLLLLVVELTHAYGQYIDMGRNKFRPTNEELNPDVRLLNNRLAKELAQNEQLASYVKDNMLSWSKDDDFIRKVLDAILKSDVYTDYINSKEDDFETDREFWRSVFKHVIANNDWFDEYLEEKCLYWNEDIDIIESFILKTLKRMGEGQGKEFQLLPMFNNNDDREFCLKLFRNTIIHSEEYRERINSNSNHWDSERVALLDLIIMQIAIAEILNFPSIPVNVTLNEYIEAAKYYSTPKSSVFINGVLEGIVKELRDERALLK